MRYTPGFAANRERFRRQWPGRFIRYGACLLVGIGGMVAGGEHWIGWFLIGLGGGAVIGDLALMYWWERRRKTWRS